MNLRLPALYSTQSGMSIGLILVAVALLSVMGMTMLLSEKTGNTTSEINKNKLLAAEIIRQGGVWHDALSATAVSNGVYMDEPDPTGSVAGYSMLDSQTGYMEPQQLPVDAFVSSASATWVWQRYTITLKNVGTGQSDILVDAVNLKQGVCQQINQLLTGSTTIPVETTGTSTGWSTTAGMNLSSETAINGVLQQCIQTSDGQYVYYQVLLAV